MSLRDGLKKLEALGAVVVGVSKDTKEAQCAFADKLGLSYYLAADTEGRLGKAFGVPAIAGYYSRVTVIVDPQGRVAQRIDDVQISAHAQQVVDVIAARQAAASGR